MPNNWLDCNFPTHKLTRNISHNQPQPAMTSHDCITVGLILELYVPVENFNLLNSKQQQQQRRSILSSRSMFKGLTVPLPCHPQGGGGGGARLSNDVGGFVSTREDLDSSRTTNDSEHQQHVLLEEDQHSLRQRSCLGVETR